MNTSTVPTRLQTSAKTNFIPPMTPLSRMSNSRTKLLRVLRRRRPSRAVARTPYMVVLSDEEKEHILQPSPYQSYRRQQIRRYDPQPKPRISTVQKYANHAGLTEAINSITGDPLEEHGGRIVTHRGNVNARLMIVGEAPGEEEDRTGKPFVGKAGQLLDKIFVYGGFNTETQLYITNVVKRRPPNNRNPTRAEIEFFLPYLLEEIRIIDPKIIVLAGSIAARALLGPHLRITKDRGRWYDVDGRSVMPVLHPSYLLRVQVAKYDMVKDIEAIRERYITLVPDETLNEIQSAKS